MAYRVQTTEQADADAGELLEWLESHAAGDAGIRWFLALQNAIASLANMPLRCALAPENSSFPFEVRHLFYGQKPHV